MAKVYDFKKLRRFILIYGVVQLFLIGLLIYMAVHFQAGLQSEGRPQRFLHSVVTALVIQLALFYPISRFAAKEVKRETEASAGGLSVEELKGLRTGRLVADVIKSAVFVFFIAFIYKAPKDLFILSVIFFSFILTILSYLQCFNFSAKKLMKEKS